MKIPKVHHDVSSYALMGGEDLVTSAIEVNPGRLSYSQNYECDLNGRYRSTDGYEAFDGQPRPSDASYWILNYTTPGTLAVGNTVTGATSGASGVILAIDATEAYIVIDKTIHSDYDYILNYDNKHPDSKFTPGNIIYQTVDGVTASATIVAAVDLGGNTGYLALSGIVGVFANNEIIYEVGYGSNLLTNGDCELNANWNNFGTPTTNERSVTQKHGGAYSRKFVGNGTGDGIENHTVTVKNECFYLIDAYAYISALTATRLNMAVWDTALTTELGLDFTTTTAGWINLQAIVQAIDTTMEVIFAQLGAGAITAYADDVNIKRITNAALANGTVYSSKFQDDENLEIAGNPEAVMDGLALEQAASTTALHNTYLQLAIETARANIAAVPGSGNVIGVHQYKGVKYAFRNNAGGTACDMYKSSSAGWVLCDLGRSLPFTSGGVYVIAEDDVVTGETGAGFATVKRVVITDGTFAGGDAVGVLVVYSQTGAFEAETIRVGANLNVATITDNSTENTLQINGKFELVNYNFYGHSDYLRMYGVDSVSAGFEWDGSTFVPILTGMTTDTPNHIAVHKKHLFFSFPGGSLQHSGIGTPYIWTPVTGASEIGIGDEITRLSVNAGLLAILSRNSTHLLYGASVDDWELKDHSLESGCIEWSAQTIGTEVYLDDRGLTTLQTTDRYGDFVGNVISDDIQPYLKTRLGNVQSSIRVKDKGQYRLYFDNMEGICLTMNKNKVIGFTRLYYDVLPVCCCSAENSSGEEELYFGSEDGFIYQLDKGTSHNGNQMEHLLRFHYNHLKTPFNEKQIRKLVLDLVAPTDTAIRYYLDFSYGDDSESTSLDFDVIDGGGVLDVAETGGAWGVFDWDEFVWDGPTVGTARGYPEGCGINFALMVISTGTYVDAHTLNAISVHYSIRGLRR